MPLVTRTVASRGLTAAKHKRLADMAALCGAVRREAWRRYGALSGLTRSNRTIRDEDWLAGPRLGERMGLPARVWKATLEDALNNIRATHAAAVAEVVRVVWRSKRPDDDKKWLSAMLRDKKWLSAMLRDKRWPADKLLHRVSGRSCRPVPCRVLSRVAVALLVIWSAASAGVFLAQDALTYHPGGPPSAAIPSGFAVVANEGPTAWAALPSTGAATVVMFHGNSGDVSTLAGRGADLAHLGYGVVLADYRGFGGNPGTPNEDGLYADARRAVAAARAQAGGGTVVAWGRSLGAAVAAEMAAEGLVDGLILESAFASLPDLASARCHCAAIVPVRLLLRDHYATLNKMPDIGVQTLVVHGADDGMVPVAVARRLFEAAGAPNKRLVLVAGGRHDLAWRGDERAAVMALLAGMSSSTPTLLPLQR